MFYTGSVINQPPKAPIMLHPSILTTYRFHRTQRVQNPIDACADAADYFGVKVSTLAAFLRVVGVDVNHLRNL